MPNYFYTASDARGVALKGKMTAADITQVRTTLAAKKLLLLEIKVAPLDAKNDLPFWQRPIHFGSRLSAQELAFITRQIASMLSAGLPLERVLAAILDQLEKPAARQILQQLLQTLQEGQTFASAIALFPKEFSSTYQALIRAGEESRDLAQVMNQLADYVDQRNSLRQKMTQAFIYPAIVTALSLLIVVFLLSYVVPQIAAVFTANRQSLPWLTRAMLGASYFIRTHGWWFFSLLLLFFAAGRLVVRRPLVQVQWHRAMLHWPIFGRLILSFNTAQFAGTLAILFNSGVPILQAMAVARDTLNNTALKLTIDNALIRIKEGASVARALAEYPYFPSSLIHFVRFGEESGQLAAMLTRAAKNERSDLERRTLLLTSLLEPILILVMGGIVLMIVLAVLLPIIEVNQLLT